MRLERTSTVTPDPEAPSLYPRHIIVAADALGIGLGPSAH